MPEKIGFMESGQQAMPFNDLIIPDFINLIQSFKADTFYFSGPNFILQDKQLSISGSCEPMSPGTVEIGLCKGLEDQPLIRIDKVSFSLVSDDGSEMKIGSKTNFIFIGSTPIATFNIYSLQPNFLPNGELRIRCRMQIGLSEEKTLWKSIQDSSIVNDLNLQFAEQNLSFPDIVLVCCKKEFPVHRYMLAARSPVFKAMFSHEETMEGQQGKVEKNNLVFSKI
jgi:hypothetical protein